MNILAKRSLDQIQAFRFINKAKSDKGFQVDLNPNKAIDSLIRYFDLPLHTSSEETIYFDYT